MNIIMALLFICASNIGIDLVEIEPISSKEVMQEVSDVVIDLKIKDEVVYVETYIPQFTFRSDRDDEDVTSGYMMVTIDDEEQIQIRQAAFMIKGLTGGEHTINFQLYDQSGLLIYEYGEVIQL